MKSVNYAICLLTLSLAAPGFTWAEAPVAAPATGTAPATMPADPKQLVAQLGADEFATRDAATKELRTLGPSALPALKEGLKNDDPEVRSRCEKLIAQIEGRGNQPGNIGGPNGGMTITGGPGGAITIVGGMGGGQIVVQGGGKIVIAQKIAVQADDKHKTVNVNDNGREVSIVESPDGIEINVTENKDGKEEKSTYKAKDVKELEEKQPEGFKIYQQYVKEGGIQLQIQGGAVIGPGGIKIGPDINVVPDEPEKAPAK